MEFNIDTKLKLNKERLEKDLNEIRNIQNSYSLYFAYLAIIGLNSLEFLSFLKSQFDSNQVDYVKTSLILLTLLFVLFSIIKFVLLLYPKEIYYDKLPKEVYDDYAKELLNFYGNPKKEIYDDIKFGYLEYLEIAVANNFKLYSLKRQLYYHVVLCSMLSLIPFSLLIILKYFYYG